LISTGRHLATVLLIAAATLLLYSDTANNSFVHDDVAFVVENSAIRNLNFKNFFSYFTDRSTTSSVEVLSSHVWRPIVTASFALDYRLWKLNARLYHLENALLHALNSALVYVTTFLILSDIPVALLAAFVFAAHPVNTEAVTWISSRSNCLFLLFFLLAFIFHIRNRRDGPRDSYYNLTAVFFLLSLLSKEMAVVFPLVIILYDSHFYRKDGLWKRVSYYFTFFLIAAFYAAARYSVLGRISQIEFAQKAGLYSNILTMMKAVCGYVRLILIPTNLRIGYYVDISRSLFEADTLFAIVILSAIALAYVWLKARSETSFYILWFFVTLIPVYNIIPFNAIMAERFLYLPSIAFASLFAIFFVGIIRANKTNTYGRLAAISALTLMMVFYVSATIMRNFEWRNDITLYSKEVERSPHDPVAHNNMGLTYAKYARANISDERVSGAYASLAIREYKEAISLSPEYDAAYKNLANLAMTMGLYDIAIENFKLALKFKEDALSYNNLSAACYCKGMFDDTIAYSKKALSLKPDYADAYINMGNAYLMKDDKAKAASAWRRAVKLGGSSPELDKGLKDLAGKGY
jgi:tetratricopeptide (TPR) repeat protein